MPKPFYEYWCYSFPVRKWRQPEDWGTAEHPSQPDNQIQRWNKVAHPLHSKPTTQIALLCLIKPMACPSLHNTASFLPLPLLSVALCGHSWDSQETPCIWKAAWNSLLWHFPVLSQPYWSDFCYIYVAPIDISLPLFPGICSLKS